MSAAIDAARTLTRLELIARISELSIEGAASPYCQNAAKAQQSTPYKA